MSNRPSLNRLSDLQQLIADFASVDRMLRLADKSRAENDVDHSYGLALTAWFLAGKIAPDLDQNKILKYALAHDLVEVYAGDTFAFGEKADLESKQVREHEALVRLSREWPDFNDLIKCIEDYENRQDEESKFVYALDKILPVLLVNLGEKASYWEKHKITKDDFSEVKRKVMVSKYIAPYYQELLDWMEQEGYYYKAK